MLKNVSLATCLVLTLAACNESDDTDDNGSNKPDDEKITVPDSYSFTSPFVEGQSGVSYTGQTKRHILIEDLKGAIKELGEDETQDVKANLDFYFRFDGSSSDSVAFDYALSGETLAPGSTYGDISSDKDLVGKIAGKDKATHLLDGQLIGWELGMDADPTPEELVDYFIAQLEAQATDGVTDQITIVGGTNVGIDKVYVSPAGHDYSQLLQKFLLGAVAYSQGTADYMQTDFSASNDSADEGKAYSSLQHKWDEAFGYFGAARNYGNYTDEEISGNGGRVEFAGSYNDANGDGSVDIRSEVNFGHSVNCGKRDRTAIVATDFTKEAFDAFLTARVILNAGETLDADQFAQFQAAKLKASQSWEKCIAATVVHYINAVISDMGDFSDDAAYVDLGAFKNHAKHWSEMKGFALSLQFNPDSFFRTDAASTDKLKEIYRLMGDAPVLADGTQNSVAFTGGVSQYETNLLAARDIIRDVYGFHADNTTVW